jgi:hypothetical protein
MVVVGKSIPEQEQEKNHLARKKRESDQTSIKVTVDKHAM